MITLIASHLVAAAAGFLFHVAWRRAIGPFLGDFAKLIITRLF